MNLERPCNGILLSSNKEPGTCASFCDSCVYSQHRAHSFVCLLFFFKTGFLCVTAVGFPGTCFVDQAGLELTEIRLYLPPECWLGFKVCATTARLHFGV